MDVVLRKRAEHPLRQGTFAAETAMMKPGENTIGLGRIEAGDGCRGCRCVKSHKSR